MRHHDHHGGVPKPSTRQPISSLESDREGPIMPRALVSRSHAAALIEERGRDLLLVDRVQEAEKADACLDGGRCRRSRSGRYTVRPGVRARRLRRRIPSACSKNGFLRERRPGDVEVER